jgi:Cof subfamily protein (haloacid dehalogenase superfamily)
VLSSVSVVATDLDGTLLRDDGRVGDRTRDALRRADAAGLCVVVVTARPHRFVTEVAGLHLHGLAICANGAMVVDLSTGVPISRSLLAVDDAAAIVTTLRRLVPGIAFAVETEDWFGHEPAYRPQWPAPVGSPVAPVEDLLDRGALKLLGRHADLHVDQLAEFTRAIGERASVTCSTTSGLLEIGPSGVTKASTLQALVGSLGLTAADVVAVGDMPNDLPMLSWAGVGAAVANAHADLLAIADLVVPSNDDEGVADLIDAVLAARTPVVRSPGPVDGRGDDR